MKRNYQTRIWISYYDPHKPKVDITRRRTGQDVAINDTFGDWGDVCAEDKATNDRALVDGTRLLSAYHTPDRVKLWIITEADRSATTILLPSEY